jgi:hypothetical protein
MGEWGLSHNGWPVPSATAYAKTRRRIEDVRCRQCDYPLWNLPTRACPECGLPFKPSEYEFVPGTVEFCCPHCGQGYFGTSARGHLVPDSFECVACHASMSMDDAVLRPAQGIDESKTEPITNPWLARQRLGFFRAFFLTLGKTLTNPGALLRATPPGKAYGASRGFFFLVAAALLSFTVVMIGLIAVAAGGAPMAFGLAFGTCGLGGNPIFVLLWIVAVFLWGLAAHLILLLTGGRKHGLSRTYESLCYGAGPMVMFLIPCIGSFATIWSIVSSTIAFKSAQETTGGRAALCVLTPPLVVMAALVVGWIILWVSMMSSFPGPGAFPPPAVGGVTTEWAISHDERARLFTTSVLGFASREGGSGPLHGLHLLDEAFVAPEDFSEDWPGDVPCFGATLASFNSMVLPERQEALKSAAGLITDRTVAHRIGDVVFTYHGIEDLNACDPALWIVVVCDDSRSSTSWIDPAQVGLADGTVRSISRDQLAAALAEQNDIRARAGLPPLPDLHFVDPARPAEAE